MERDDRRPGEEVGGREKALVRSLGSQLAKQKGSIVDKARSICNVVIC